MTGLKTLDRVFVFFLSFFLFPYTLAPQKEKEENDRRPSVKSGSCSRSGLFFREKTYRVNAREEEEEAEGAGPPEPAEIPLASF